MRLLIPACLLLLALTGLCALRLESPASAAIHVERKADAPVLAVAPKAVSVAPVAPAMVWPLLPAAPVRKAAPVVEPARPVFLGQEVQAEVPPSDELLPLGSRTRLVGRAQGIFPLLLRDGSAGDGVSKDGGPRTDSEHAARVELGLRFTF